MLVHCLLMFPKMDSNWTIVVFLLKLILAFCMKKAEPYLMRLLNHFQALLINYFVSQSSLDVADIIDLLIEVSTKKQIVFETIKSR